MNSQAQCLNGQRWIQQKELSADLLGTCIFSCIGLWLMFISRQATKQKMKRNTSRKWLDIKAEHSWFFSFKVASKTWLFCPFNVFKYCFFFFLKRFKTYKSIWNSILHIPCLHTCVSKTAPLTSVHRHRQKRGKSIIFF